MSRLLVANRHQSKSSLKRFVLQKAMSKCSGTKACSRLTVTDARFWSGVLPQQILGETLTHLDYYTPASAPDAASAASV